MAALTAHLCIWGLGPNSFSFDYNTDYTEISVSFVSEIVFEELVIPLLLVPIYFAVFLSRRQAFRRFMLDIETAQSKSVLRELESEINEAVKQKKIKVYHGLVLRNTIESVEDNFDDQDCEEE